jgi:hypothetical protein
MLAPAENDCRWRRDVPEHSCSTTPPPRPGRSTRWSSASGRRSGCRRWAAGGRCPVSARPDWSCSTPTTTRRTWCPPMVNRSRSPWTAAPPHRSPRMDRSGRWSVAIWSARPRLPHSALGSASMTTRCCRWSATCRWSSTCPVVAPAWETAPGGRSTPTSTPARSWLRCRVHGASVDGSERPTICGACRQAV